ncbi:pentapeptide repeat-containing protein [Nakamurella antarctica]|uniref:Pentapeptide repeat-containing protein n=1 Tax=Nakamurella antarctica TaxID=1902245 RepID=A0A3G8ZX44_9ACTN|nr:pentapeptide repeat-containing protein [Nakamurella antarctica]AZI58231.1 pentapeptide repeat-containing protein [Nakamurella antarctica]
MRTFFTPIPRERGRATRLVRRAALASLASLAALLIGSQAMASSAAPQACAPLSGVQMAKHVFTAAEVSQRPNFSCADLRGASFVGLRLGQVNFVGANLTGAKLAGAELSQANFSKANLTGADLAGADLVQATLVGANLTGSSLVGADLGQAEAGGAVFTGADLSKAKLTQTNLTNAVMDQTNLSGTSFMQATLTGATLEGATGVVRWDIYVAVGALALLTLLIIGFLVTALTRNLQGASLVRVLTFGILGRVSLVLGIHFLLGGLIGVFGTVLLGPVAQMCSGPQCAIGIDRGMQGTFIGVGLIVVSTFLMAFARPGRAWLPLAFFLPSFFELNS